MLAAVIILGVLAGVVAANNKESSPGTVVNQQSTTNSLGVSVQSPTRTETTTVTAPTKTVTAPAQTVTAPAITAPGTQTGTTPAKAP